MIPKILLYADSYNGRVGTSDAYAEFFSKFGEVILVSSTNDLKFFIEHGDILALPGGADVDPMRYKERPIYLTGRTNIHYEYLDKFLLEPWIQTGKPIIGICRGAQTLNVALGGNLIQHVDGHVGGEDRNKAGDKIYTNIEGWPVHVVNSYHHQAIGRLGEGLEILGWGPIYKGCTSLSMSRRKLITRKKYDKIPIEQLPFDERQKILSKFQAGKPKSVWGWTKDEIWAIPEIVRHTTKPYVAFQYHPEEFNCDLAIELITNMLEEYYGEGTEEAFNNLQLLSPSKDQYGTAEKKNSSKIESPSEGNTSNELQ